MIELVGIVFILGMGMSFYLNNRSEIRSKQKDIEELLS